MSLMSSFLQGGEVVTVMSSNLQVEVFMALMSSFLQGGEVFMALMSSLFSVGRSS